MTAWALVELAAHVAGAVFGVAAYRHFARTSAAWPTLWSTAGALCALSLLVWTLAASASVLAEVIL